MTLAPGCSLCRQRRWRRKWSGNNLLPGANVFYKLQVAKLFKRNSVGASGIFEKKNLRDDFKALELSQLKTFISVYVNDDCIILILMSIKVSTIFVWVHCIVWTSIIKASYLSQVFSYHKITFYITASPGQNFNPHLMRHFHPVNSLVVSRNLQLILLSKIWFFLNLAKHATKI